MSIFLFEHLFKSTERLMELYRSEMCYTLQIPGGFKLMCFILVLFLGHGTKLIPFSTWQYHHWTENLNPFYELHKYVQLSVATISGNSVETNENDMILHDQGLNITLNIFFKENFSLQQHMDGCLMLMVFRLSEIYCYPVEA